MYRDHYSTTCVSKFIAASSFSIFLFYHDFYFFQYPGNRGAVPYIDIYYTFLSFIRLGGRIAYFQGFTDLNGDVSEVKSDVLEVERRRFGSSRALTSPSGDRQKRRFGSRKATYFFFQMSLFSTGIVSGQTPERLSCTRKSHRLPFVISVRKNKEGDYFSFTKGR